MHDNDVFALLGDTFGDTSVEEVVENDEVEDNGDCNCCALSTVI